MKKSVQSTIVLVAICAVMAILLALTNSVTAPIIKQNQDAAANEALLVVMPDGEGFEKVDISSYTLPATVTEVYKETKGGYVVTLTTAGYGSGLIVMCGVSPDGTVTGAVCLASTETLGYEKTFGENFTGRAEQKGNTLNNCTLNKCDNHYYRYGIRSPKHFYWCCKPSPNSISTFF